MKYTIKDASGAVTNTINADAAFVEANFPHYEVYEEQDLPLISEEAAARTWRSSELADTDQAAMIPDYPNRDAIVAYRTALRDWPSTEDFPATKPEM